MVDATCLESGFEVTLGDGTLERCRKLLLATEIRDHLPEIEGIDELYGTSVHHCPYCDGWGWRDQPLAIYGAGIKGYRFVRSMLNWSRDLALLTDGPADLETTQQAVLAHWGVPVREERIARLEGRDGKLQRVLFVDGGSIERRALFFHGGTSANSNLADRLGCPVRHGSIESGPFESTQIPGL